jgi:hypothetical protein
MAPTIRFYKQDGAIKYRQNGTVYTVKEGEVNGTMIGSAVSEYLYHKPVTANWETLSGKPDVFPPDTHIHLENAPALHQHEGYSNSTHLHEGVYASGNHTHAYSPILHAHPQYANATHTHPSSGGNGYCLQVAALNQATTTDSQTVYWGGAHSMAQQTSSGVHRLYIPKSGTIKACYIYVHAGTAGTGENWT